MTAINNYIVTAADKKFYKSFCQLMYSYHRVIEYQNSKVIFYDLGLTKEQADEIQYQKKAIFKHVAYRVFPFDEYPEFVHPSYQTYSWKPILLHSLSTEIFGNILWLDSANCIHENLKTIWNKIDDNLIYSPLSGSGTLEEWTVQETLRYMDVPKSFYKKRNRAGNTFGFTTKSKVTIKLIEKWKNLSLIPECIKPSGANRSNHRDDQSLLTILLLERELGGELELTNDEVNISSGSPINSISVRNRFPKLIPLPYGNLAYLYFKILRSIDMIINKVRGN